jgi:electron transport complex protein RnfC
VLTLTGDAIKTPKNILARVGTTFADLIAFCGGLTAPAGKIICGGPMMGVAQTTLDAAVAKTTSGILCLGRNAAQNYLSQPCIGCGRCVRACPSGLLPCTLSEALEAEQYDAVEELNVLDCIECGACAYECPARRPLVQFMRQGKSQTLLRRRQREARKKGEKKS